MSTDLVTTLETIPAAFRVSWYGGKPPEVDQGTSLVPVADCQRIIAAYEGMKTCAASEAEAAKTVKDLFDAWPQKKPENMRVLFKVVKEAFMTIPYSLHGAVFTILTNRQEFLPTKAHVVKAIEEVTEPFLCASIMARKHLFEHQKRAAQSAPTPRLADTSVNLKQRLKEMPETSELAAALCGTLCRLEGRDPMTDADIAERKEAMRRQIAEAPSLPAVQKPLSPEAQARRDLLMQSLAEKRQAISERVGV